jgi:hypothetical protein
MRRLADGQLKFPREMRRASTHYGAEFPYAEGAVQILIDKSFHPRYLPARQSGRWRPVSA